MNRRRRERISQGVRWIVADRLGRHGPPVVGDSPYIEERALERWRAAVADAAVYLEYGSGGSTVEACRTATHVVSVESDRRYLGGVRRRVASDPRATASFHPVHGDIGFTLAWGHPLLDRRTPARLRRWRRYTAAPWPLLRKAGLTPDFIFVDGRFRVASVLESFLQLRAGSRCLFMLDDFERRAQRYRAVLDFAEDVEQVGRALVFRRRADLDRAACAEALRQHQADPK